MVVLMMVMGWEDSEEESEWSGVKPHYEPATVIPLGGDGWIWGDLAASHVNCKAWRLGRAAPGGNPQIKPITTSTSLSALLDYL